MASSPTGPTGPLNDPEEERQPPETPITMQNLWRSSNLDSVGYDQTNRILLVQFRNGRQYRWDGIPSTAYDELRDAISPGRVLKEIEREYGYGVRID